MPVPQWKVRKGPNAGKYKVTDDEVRAIRKMSAVEGMSAPEISDLFSIGPEAVRRIVNRTSHKDVPDIAPIETGRATEDIHQQLEMAKAAGRAARAEFGGKPPPVVEVIEPVVSPKDFINRYQTMGTDIVKKDAEAVRAAMRRSPMSEDGDELEPDEPPPEGLMKLQAAAKAAIPPPADDMLRELEEGDDRGAMS